MEEEEKIISEITNKEKNREQKRAVDRSKRNIVKLKRKLDLQKKTMLLEIKKMVKKGQIKGAKMLIKDIIKISNLIKKLDQFIGQLTAISMRISFCYTLKKLEEEMNNISKTISLFNNKLNSRHINIIGKEFDKETMKLDLNLEIMQEVMTESMESEEDEKELYNEVLKEVGIRNDEEMVGINEKLNDEKIDLGKEKHLVGIGSNN